MSANECWVNHSRRRHILILKVFRDTVQSHLNSLSLLRWPSEELVVFCITQLLVRCHCVKIHMFRLDSFLLPSKLPFSKIAISTNNDITHIVHISFVSFAITYKFRVFPQKGSLIQCFMAVWGQNVAHHLLLVISNLNMSYLT